MGIPAAGQVVVLPFPYSDLSGQKKRPAILIAPAGNLDWVICQITSNPFSDPRAIPLTPENFASGGLHHISYVRPSKLFTANESLIVAEAGVLRQTMLLHIRDAILEFIRTA